ncbi:MAG: preprotein translocase subunit SecG [Candidatus Komeilibacteria bacterium CG_4_10_14_0_2_um_filter_37_10]|uniref:Protein-export membrane protein SecG n=1 Tax=Candidatus Komeilibacteria bacterium CG_4_10_14_0_2_um_filter_37_10 TaxID=1974470 RepID=A0A2M7VDP1_9BACT|nr:MAG: preprotein translocase subunit SecG [Candidatus Komeilibacteria bacterium CG_4_10_14_0_2_um_filter_37_10]
MKQTIQIIQIIVSILLIVVVLLQNRGSGLGAAFGGDNAIYRTKRGAEKIIFITTIVLAVLFFVLALAQIFI